MTVMHKQLNWSVVACSGTGGDDFSSDHVGRASPNFGLFWPDNKCFGDKARRSTGPAKSLRHGWDGGRKDKCCRSTPTSCRWFPSSAACEKAVSSPALGCLGCSEGDANIGCPQWAANASMHSQIHTLEHLQAGMQVVVTGSTGPPTQSYPVVIRHHRRGVCAHIPVGDASTNDRLDLHAHVLPRLSDDVTPFRLMVNESDDGAQAQDGRARVEMSLARAGGLASHPREQCRCHQAAIATCSCRRGRDCGCRFESGTRVWRG